MPEKRDSIIGSNYTIAQKVVERERKKQEFREVAIRYRNEIWAIDSSIIQDSMSAGQQVLPFEER